jgi:hypothetical protein
MSDAMLLTSSELSDREAAILDFEKQWWSLPGTKEDEVRARFDLSSPRYYQILNQLLDSPAAMAYSPLLVKRLRRQREQRQRERSARRLGITITV